MKGFENIKAEVAVDLIELVNQLRGLEKSAQVIYSVQNRKTGEWVKKAFNYVPLDNILNKIKENKHFALLQPIGVDENGIMVFDVFLFTRADTYSRQTLIRLQ